MILVIIQKKLDSLKFSETFRALLLKKTPSWMLPARFCRINNTRYLIQIQQTNKYWLYRNANPYIFVTKRKKTMSRGWVKDIAHFHEIIWAKKMYIRTQKGLKLLLTTNAYRSSTFRKKRWNLKIFILVFYDFTSSFFEKKYIVMFHSLGAFQRYKLYRLWLSFWKVTKVGKTCIMKTWR